MKIEKLFMFAFVLVLLISGISFASATSDSVEVDDYLIEYSYDSAEAGKRFSLEVSITNLDDSSRENVTFEFDFKNPFDEVTSDTWEIGTLAADEIVTKSFRVEIDDDAESKKEYIEFKIEDSKDDYEDEVEIKVTTDAADIDYIELKSFPSRISANQEEIKFVVTLQNEGEEDVENMKAELILPEGFSFSDSYSNVDNLGLLKSGEKVEAEFYFDTEKGLLADIYEAELKLDYESEGDDETKILILDVPIKPTPQFSIVSVSTDSKVYAGGESVVKIKLLNFGEEEGKETSVKVFEKSEHPFEFVEKSSSVGFMKPNEDGVAVFKFKTDGDATLGEYIIDFQIRTISSGGVLVFEDSFKVNVYKKERGYTGFVITLIAVVVLLGVFFYQKKKKK